jgi:hypothetical protein
LRTIEDGRFDVDEALAVLDDGLATEARPLGRRRADGAAAAVMAMRIMR